MSTKVMRNGRELSGFTDITRSEILEIVENKEDKLTVSASGKNVTLQGTVSGKARIKPVKNLIPYPYHGYTNDAGITWVEENGFVTASGTATDNAVYNCRIRTSNETIFLILKPGVYTISGCPNGGSSSTYKIQVGQTLNGTYSLIANDIGKGATFTIKEDTQLQIQCVIGKGVTVDNLTFKPMLEAGTTVHGYVPYRGYEVTSHGKNLLPAFDVNVTMSNGITVKSDGSGGYIFNGDSTAWAFTNLNYKKGVRNLPNGSYKLISNADSFMSVLGTDDSGATLLNAKANSGIFEVTDEMTSVWVRIEIAGTNSLKDKVVYFMIVPADCDDTTYEPYKSSTATVSQTLDEIHVLSYDGVTNISSIGEFTAYAPISDAGAALIDGSVDDVKNYVDDELDKKQDTLVNTVLPEQKNLLPNGSNIDDILTDTVCILSSEYTYKGTMPSGVKYGLLQTQKSSTFITQHLTNTTSTYFRFYANSAWGAWTELASASVATDVFKPGLHSGTNVDFNNYSLFGWYVVWNTSEPLAGGVKFPNTNFYIRCNGMIQTMFTWDNKVYTRHYVNNKWTSFAKILTDKEDVVNYDAKITKNSALTYTNGRFSLIKCGRMAQFQLYDVSIQSLKHGDVICTLPSECRPSVYTRVSFTMPPSEGAAKVGLSSNSDWVVLPGAINENGTVVIYTTSTGAPARMSSGKANVTFITAN